MEIPRQEIWNVKNSIDSNEDQKIQKGGLQAGGKSKFYKKKHLYNKKFLETKHNTNNFLLGPKQIINDNWT